MTTSQPGAQTLDCGCEESRSASAKFSRRTMFRLGAAGGLIGATTLSGASLVFGAPAGTGTLVVLTLIGGFDGLSAIVPVGDPNYYSARPGIAVPASQTHKIDSMFGLHPALKPVFGLFDNGTMAAVHAVGQAEASRSHFQAMSELERAAPGTSLRTGWIDRTLGQIGDPGGFTGTSIGGMPATMLGTNHKFAMNSIDGVKLAIGEDVVSLDRWRSSMDILNHGAPEDLTMSLDQTFDAVGSMAKVTAKKSKTAKELKYPDTGLGNALHDVARLIKADVGLRVATVGWDGWDMHIGLGSSDSGQMHDKLTEMSTAFAAFAAELGDKALARTTLITLSEFGRRVEQNGSGGLDHGHGNAVLVLGGGLKKGVHGRWPGLAPNHLDYGDLAGTTDYRAIVSEVFKKRVGIDSTVDIFPGYKAKPVGLA